MQRYLGPSRHLERRCQVAAAKHGSEQPRCGTSVDAANALVTLASAQLNRQGVLQVYSDGRREDASCDCGSSDLENSAHIVAVRSAVGAAIINFGVVNVGVGYLCSLLFATI